MSRRALPRHQYPEHGRGVALITLQETVDRLVRLSKADSCIVLARRVATANIRWAHNMVTTNGDTDEVQLSVIPIIGCKVASITRTYCPPDELEAFVREAEAACARRPDAPDCMPLVEGGGTPDDWEAPPADSDIHVFDPLIPQLAALFERARRAGISTFGYAEFRTETTLLATSAGLKKRHTDRMGKIDITAKPPDFSRSSWVGQATRDFLDVDTGEMFERLQQRLGWAERHIDLPAGPYEVLLEPSCAADLAIGVYSFMSRRDADEGRSPFSRAGGGTLVGERLFGSATLYSDPAEKGIEAAPFHCGVESRDTSSVFDNGADLPRTTWVRDGVLTDLVTPRYWAHKMALERAVPFIDNLVLGGSGPTVNEMIATTERALLVTCLWYIRVVDPQTALMTGLTRDGVYLVERGTVKGAVNNFRWNMSPIVALAQATEIGRTGLALPREHDEFLRSKAPALRVERFHMSSVSEAR